MEKELFSFISFISNRDFSEDKLSEDMEELKFEAIFREHIESFLHEWCDEYLQKETHLTPRYSQLFMEFDTEKINFYVCSTLSMSFRRTLELDEQELRFLYDIDRKHMGIHDMYKKYRTKFLIENYPTIDPY